MHYEFEDDATERLAYALELFCGDVVDDDEWDQYFDDVAQQWSHFKDQGREVRDAWQTVLAKNDGKLANYLVHKWANQGDYQPKEALRVLRKWYDHLQPLWDSLQTDEPPGPIQLPPYVCDH